LIQKVAYGSNVKRYCRGSESKEAAAIGRKVGGFLTADLLQEICGFTL